MLLADCIDKLDEMAETRGTENIDEITRVKAKFESVLKKVSDSQIQISVVSDFFCDLLEDAMQEEARSHEFLDIYEEHKHLLMKARKTAHRDRIERIRKRYKEIKKNKIGGVRTPSEPSQTSTDENEQEEEEEEEEEEEKEEEEEEEEGAFDDAFHYMKMNYRDE